jgi:hypothetical protein
VVSTPPRDLLVGCADDSAQSGLRLSGVEAVIPGKGERVDGLPEFPLPPLATKQPALCRPGRVSQTQDWKSNPLDRLAASGAESQYSGQSPADPELCSSRELFLTSPYASSSRPRPPTPDRPYLTAPIAPQAKEMPSRASEQSAPPVAPAEVFEQPAEPAGPEPDHSDLHPDWDRLTRQQRDELLIYGELLDE